MGIHNNSKIQTVIALTKANERTKTTVSNYEVVICDLRKEEDAFNLY